MNFVNHFPEGYKPTSTQISVLNSIDKAFESGKRFVVVNAPTGTGKSFIAKTIGNAAKQIPQITRESINNYSAFKRDSYGRYTLAEELMNAPRGGAFVLTTTKALQDQYDDLFEDIVSIKGMSNYQCEVDDKYSVDVAPCIHTPAIRKDCWNCNMCPYYSRRNEALTANLGALNYDMFLSLPEHVKQREYIVCDEASELEEQLIKTFSCTLNIKILSSIYGIVFTPLPDQYGKLGRWVSAVSVQCGNIVLELKSELSKNKKRGIQYNKTQKKYLNLLNIYNNLRRMVDTWSVCEYVLERGGKEVTFKPLKVDKLSHYIFENGQRIILMSATIIDHKNFSKTLGIKNEEYTYIEVESPFDPKHAPIYCSNKVRLSYRNLQSQLPTIVSQIQKICDAHKNEKGIIHTHTNLITEILRKGLKGDRFLVREPGVTNEMLLRDHFNKQGNSVLVSPSMSFGVDLKDDLARFQIIIKAPFLPLNEERTKRMMETDNDWYINKMLISLIQSCGRGIRSKDDHCKTYILDGTITNSIIKNKEKLPKYFIDRLV